MAQTKAKRATGRPTDETLGPVIIDAVRRLLAEGGYAGLTTAGVAKRAQVSTATLYRRWPTKHELVLAVTEQIASEHTSPVDTGSLEGDLHALIDKKSRLLSGHTGAALLALLGETPRDPELRSILRRSLYDGTLDHLETIRRQAERRGEQDRPVDPEQARRAILGAILTALSFAPRPEGSPALSPSEVAQLAHSLIIAPREGTVATSEENS